MNAEHVVVLVFLTVNVIVLEVLKIAREYVVEIR